MDPVAFLGTYKALPTLDELGMPAITEDTLWQIWKHANGNHWVGPLSYEDPQHAGGYTVTKNIVDEGFIKISEEIKKDGFLCSHDPYLILEWYSQVTPENHVTADASLSKSPVEPVAEEVLSEEELIAQLTKHVQEQSLNIATVPAVEEPNIDTEQGVSQVSDPIKTLEQVIDQENVKEPAGESAGEPAGEHTLKENVQKNLSHTDLAFSLDGAPAQLGERNIGANRDVVAQKNIDVVAKEAISAEVSERLEEGARKQFTFLMQLWDSQPGKYIEAQIQIFLKDPCPYREETKFLFSDFGVQLRRRGLYSLALICHSHALICSPSDENILFNVARAEYELGNTDATKKYLQKALDIDPEFAVAKNFYNFLSAKQ